jgi:hypothetical protein
MYAFSIHLVTPPVKCSLSDISDANSFHESPVSRLEEKGPSGEGPVEGIERGSNTNLGHSPPQIRRKKIASSDERGGVAGRTTGKSPTPHEIDQAVLPSMCEQFR